MCESVHIFVSVNGAMNAYVTPLLLCQGRVWRCNGKGWGEVIYFFSEG